MSIRLTNNRLVVKDGLRTVLDTNDGLYHTMTKDLVGSRTFAAEYASQNAIRNDTTVYTIGTCHASCTHVIGAVYIGATDASAWGLAYNRWTTYLGGTIPWALTAPGLTQDSAGDIGDVPHTFLGYTFSTSGGVVRLTKKLMMPDSPNVYVIKAHSMRWRLQAGLFS